MRRSVTVVVVTVGGLGLLASFHSTPGVASKALVTVPRATQPPAGAAPPTTGAGTQAPPTTGATGSPTTSPPAAEPPTTSATRTIDGPVESNRYGDVQVQITVSGGSLVDVEATELPQDRERSAEISSIAGPELRQEALQARSANIDIISGATYTSESYAQSLQAALDRAGLDRAGL